MDEGPHAGAAADDREPAAPDHLAKGSVPGRGGARAATHLRQVFGELKVPVVRQAVGLSLHLDVEDFERLAPRPQLAGQLDTLLDEVALWGHALRGVRGALVPAA